MNGAWRAIVALATTIAWAVVFAGTAAGAQDEAKPGDTHQSAEDENQGA